MGTEVLLGHHLPSSGTDLAVQLQVAVGGARLPGTLFVLLGLAAALLLQDPVVTVSCQELLLLVGVREEHEQLIEDLPEVFSQQLPAAPVVLGC